MILFILVFSIVIVLAAWTKTSEQGNTQDNNVIENTDKGNENTEILDKETFEKNFIEQNKTLENVQLKLDGDYLFFGVQSYVKIHGMYFYDGKTLEKTAYLSNVSIKGSNGEMSGYSIYMKPGVPDRKYEGEKGKKFLLIWTKKWIMEKI